MEEIINLLSNLKDYLNIPADITEYDGKLTLIIQTSADRIINLTKVSGETAYKKFLLPTHQQALLFDCCRYAFNNASEFFFNNFKPDLLCMWGDEFNAY